jgi:hypothetical protein
MIVPLFAFAVVGPALLEAVADAVDKHRVAKEPANHILHRPRPVERLPVSKKDIRDLTSGNKKKVKEALRRARLRKKLEA